MARSRDPRSRATRFLLAERYFTTGRVTAALVEMQALVGLQSRGLEVFIPALVGYARSPGAVPQLKAYFQKYPRLEPNVLALLAQDAANADLVMSLATQRNPVPDWRANLVSALVASGQYDKAYSTWEQVSGINRRPGLSTLALQTSPHRRRSTGHSKSPAKASPSQTARAACPSYITGAPMPCSPSS